MVEYFVHLNGTCVHVVFTPGILFFSRLATAAEADPSSLAIVWCIAALREAGRPRSGRVSSNLAGVNTYQ